MSLEQYSPGQRVAVIINRKTSEAAGLPYVIAGGIAGQRTDDGRLWVSLELMGERGLPQMIEARDIVGHTFRQPPTSSAPLPNGMPRGL